MRIGQEMEGLRGWMYFGNHLLETHSSTQQIVALSTAESHEGCSSRSGGSNVE